MSDKENAKKRVRPTKDYVEYNAEYRSIFPNVSPQGKDKWTEYEFTVARPRGIKDPTYQGRGIFQPPHGSRLRLLIDDDICTFENTITEPGLREKVKDSWSNAFDSRTSPDSLIMHIGGVIHEKDLNNQLMEDPRFWFVKQSIGSDFEHLVHEDLRTGAVQKFPLWKAWTPEWLEKKWQANSRAFDRSYRHKGYAEGEKPFDPEYIRAAIIHANLPTNAPAIFIGVDLSSKKRPGNVIFVLGLFGTTRRVLSIDRGAWTSPQTAEKIVAAINKWKPIAVLVENNAYQNSLIEWIEALYPEYAAPIEGLFTGRQKADEELGIPGLAAEMKAGKWEIPFDPGHAIGLGCQCPRCVFVAEMEDYPATKADVLMAAWFARAGVLKYGGVSSIEISNTRAPVKKRHQAANNRERRKQVRNRMRMFRSKRSGRPTSADDEEE